MERIVLAEQQDKSLVGMGLCVCLCAHVRVLGGTGDENVGADQ